MKQIDKILADVNYPIKELKLVKCVQAHNEEDWIQANLANCYDEFDIIRVLEGAVEGRPNSTSDGHSTDRTLELIRSFPDPAGKIELITWDRPFKSLEQMKQVFLDAASENEYLFIVDADEFYMDGDVNKVRQAIYRHPRASEFIPTFLHFYRDFRHLKAPHPEWQPQHQRILRYRKGLRYHTHPVATLSNGMCSYFDPAIQTERYTLPGIYIYHYGHAKPFEEHKKKAEFYTKELAKFEGRGGSAANEFNLKLDEFLNFKEDLNTILHYDGTHPLVIQSHPLFGSHEVFYSGKPLLNWKQDKIYSKSTLPNIVVWMEDFWGTRRMNTFFNVA